MKTIFLAVAASFLLFSSCDTTEIGYAKDVNPDAVWQQYNIWYDEADDSVICHAQFRFAGESGTSLVLDSNSNVMLDNKQLQVDSNILPGAYYIQAVHPKTFVGEHVFSYTDINGKKYTNAFVFTPIDLPDDLPQTINSHTDLKLRFSGLADMELLRISLSDTAYTSVDIDSSFTLREQSITIPAACIAKMVSGPLRLEVSYEKKLALQQTAKEGGEMNLLYALRPKTIILVESWE